MTADIAQAFTYFLAMLISLSFHEAAHAFAARAQGDRTALLAGRLTLNPLAHAELFGTLVLPLVGALMSMPLIGWAKPVPVDPRQMRNRRWGHVYVAAAGPLANLLLGLLCSLFLGFYQLYLGTLVPPESFFFPLVKLAAAMVSINAILAVFNLIPLPPLDGATLLEAFLPPELARAYHEKVAPYGFAILMLLFFAGGLFWISPLARGYVTLVHTVTTLVFAGHGV